MELLVCLETKDVWLDGQMLMLASRETEVLLKLVQNHGRTTSRDLLASIWDETPTEDGVHCVQNIIHKLRMALGVNAIYTRTGVGYVLMIPTRVVPAGLVCGPPDPLGTTPEAGK
jgi:DNA-binding response OmpR family regulator